ncbi:hypothetical protein F5Y19DRAFT_329803 [Xylariaceae sp. FL1651]|nr:hypothetical protein F5Y19DRAFT_329803 [Xylariaceae sp. FL1651]
MNMFDINNIDQDRKPLWITSVRTMTFVIGLAYLYGYRWENWKEHPKRRRRTRYAKCIVDHGARALRSAASLAGPVRRLRGMSSLDDLEKGSVERRFILHPPTCSSAFHIWGR